MTPPTPAPKLTKLIWLSDPHFTAEGDVLGHDPRARLAAALDHIAAHHSDADLCVISGDMVNRGTATDYRALAGLLDRLTIPYYPMVGNHDDRHLFSEHLPLPDDRMAGFVQYAHETDAATIICLDTQKPGSDAGAFCKERLRWLDETLARDPGKPAILFMHHPPMPLGLPMQDADNLHDGARLLDLLKRHPRVAYLCIGHVHRPVTGTVRGIPFATMGSVLYQAPAPHPAWTWDTFEPAREAPSLGVLCIQGTDVTLQYIQFCGYRTGTR